MRCDGLSVYPGLFDAATRVGLGEIGSVAGSNDASEIGGNQADLRVTASIHAASAHIPVTRCDGVTNALVLPQGGPIAGRATLVNLDGWTWEQMVVGESLALLIQAPGASGDDPPEKEREGDWKQLAEKFDEALRYADARGRLAERGATSLSAAPYARPGRRGAEATLFADSRRAARGGALRGAAQAERALLGAARRGSSPTPEGARRALPVANSLGLPGADQRDAQFQNAARLHAAGSRSRSSRSSRRTSASSATTPAWRPRTGCRATRR